MKASPAEHQRSGGDPFARRRVILLGIFTAVVAAAVGYVQVTVPLPEPTFSRADAGAYLWVAMAGSVVVLLGTATTIWYSWRAWRRQP